MATIKSYTDPSQSKKLAEILSLESADMCWQYQKDRWVGEPDYKEFPQFEHATDKRDIAYWSLAALLGVLTKNKICHYDDRYYCQYMSEGDEFPIYSTAEYDNPVDACVAMIEKLNELNLL